MTNVHIDAHTYTCAYFTPLLPVLEKKQTNRFNRLACIATDIKPNDLDHLISIEPSLMSATGR